MPFLKNVRPDLGLLYIPFGALVIAGAANAVNLTDGLDGLAIGPVMIAAATYAVFSYAAGNAIFAEYLQIPYVRGRRRARRLLRRAGRRRASASSGSTPTRRRCSWATSARCALGAALGMVALITRQEIVLLLVGGVFVVETLSVIGQVASFKLRRKRIFRMAPIHHHFELLGWPEPQIIVRFWIVADHLRADRALHAEAPRDGGCRSGALVVGFRRTGQAVARVAGRARLRRARAPTRGDGRRARRSARRRLPGVELRLGAETPALLDGVDLVVPSPGVPREAPLLARGGSPRHSRPGARSSWRPACSTVRSSAITGTNGKSTTTTLVGRALRARRAAARSPAATSARR